MLEQWADQLAGRSGPRCQGGRDKVNGGHGRVSLAGLGEPPGSRIEEKLATRVAVHTRPSRLCHLRCAQPGRFPLVALSHELARGVLGDPRTCTP